MPGNLPAFQPLLAVNHLLQKLQFLILKPFSMGQPDRRRQWNMIIFGDPPELAHGFFFTGENSPMPLSFAGSWSTQTEITVSLAWRRTRDSTSSSCAVNPAKASTITVYPFKKGVASKTFFSLVRSSRDLCSFGKPMPHRRPSPDRFPVFFSLGFPPPGGPRRPLDPPAGCRTF